MGTDICNRCGSKGYGCPQCRYVPALNPPEVTASVVEQILLTTRKQAEDETVQRIASFFKGDSNQWIREIILSGRWKTT